MTRAVAANFWCVATASFISPLLASASATQSCCTATSSRAISPGASSCIRSRSASRRRTVRSHSPVRAAISATRQPASQTSRNSRRWRPLPARKRRGGFKFVRSSIMNASSHAGAPSRIGGRASAALTGKGRGTSRDDLACFAAFLALQAG